MYHLTIGEVSGVIAAIVAVSQLLLPNVIILILVGILKDTHSAVTWSVVGNSLANSQWPWLLRSDTTASRGVDATVRWVSWVRPLGLLLIFIAATVTPLGLYESLEMDSDAQMAPFEYLADTGPMGYGTPPRSDHRFTRICSIGGLFDELPLQCPGTTTAINYSINAEWRNATWNDIEPRIPDFLVSLYQSGLDALPQTVSSFFDIQSRQYNYQTQEGVLHDSKYLVAAFRPLTMMALDDSIEAVEGLVVDTQKGGIGLRNHTAPTSLQYGAEWHEDILFLEPDTACVDTNITIEFEVPEFLGTIQNYTLVDNGGFVNFNRSYRDVHFWEKDTQKDPLLFERAYEAAWMFNAYNMLYLNVTRPRPDAFGYLKSEIGKRFPISNSLGGYASFSEILITASFSGLVNPPFAWENGTLMNDSIPTIYSNPWNISEDNYTAISDFCRGSLGGDFANITNINMQCGLAVGAARRKDGVESLVFEKGTAMVQSMYTCASSTKATIKDVHFRFNASNGDGLKRLQVLNVSDKFYPNQSSKPLWGVESPWNYTISELNQLWGIISESRRSSVNLSTVRSERLYLPTAFWSILGTGTMADYTVGTQAPGNAWSGTYGLSPGSILGSGQDYTGSSSVAMFVKWQELSRAPSTTSTMINIIWTDIMASSVVGTRSWTSGDSYPWDQKHSKRDGVSASSSTTRVPVYIYNRRIRYHWVFAIPAFICIALCASVFLAAIAFNLKGNGTVARVRHFVTHLSPGRLLGALVFQDEVQFSFKTEEWIAAVGHNQIQILTGDPPGFTAPSIDSNRDSDYKDECDSSSAEKAIGAEPGQTPREPNGRDKADSKPTHLKQGGSESLKDACETIEEVPSSPPGDPAFSDFPSQRGGYVRAARDEDEISA